MSISSSLPEPQKYVYINENPILRCLVDQCLGDNEWKGKIRDEKDLADQIVNAIDANLIDWPTFTIMSKKNWASKMKNDQISFYKSCAGSSERMEQFEFLLLELAGMVLKRRIFLYSLMNITEPRIFNDSGHGIADFSIMGCTSLMHQNFFISLQRN